MFYYQEYLFPLLLILTQIILIIGFIVELRKKKSKN